MKFFTKRNKKLFLSKSVNNRKIYFFDKTKNNDENSKY